MLITKKKRKEEPKKTSDYLGQNLRNSSLAIRPQIDQNLVPQSRSVISGSAHYPPLTTVRLFVYGEGMRSVGKNVVTTSGGKFIGKGTSEKLMCMYVNEKGIASLSDLVPKHYIVGEVYEVPESKIEFLRKQDDGRTIDKIWVKMPDEDNQVALRMCFTSFFNDVTAHYLNNEAIIVEGGDWFAYRNNELSKLFKDVHL